MSYADLRCAVLCCVQLLAQLLGRTDARLLQHAALAVMHLAALPALREPLGRAGVVPALLSAIRQWYDLPGPEQKAQKVGPTADTVCRELN